MHPSGLNVGAFGFQTQEEHPMTARVPASDRTRKPIAELLSGDFDKSALLRNEPPREFRRLIAVSHAAMADSVSRR